MKVLIRLIALTLMLEMLFPNLSIFASTAQGINGSNERTILNFNNNWGFYRGDLAGAESVGFDDGAFAAVTIPHTMRLEKKHANGASAVYQGIGWYRRYFTIDESYRGKKINIDFEGVMIDSDVYLNGEKIYTHNGGYIGYSVDITSKVKFGQTNVLAVRVSSFDNPDTPPGKPLANLDFHYYGGIYRDVTMRITNKLHISDALQANKTASGGVFVTYPEVSSSKATVNVKTHVVNENDVSAQTKVISKLVDKNGNVVAQGETDTTSIAAGGDNQFNQNLTVVNPNLWSIDSPYLYSLVSEVYNASSLVDSITTKLGIRTIEYKSDGFYLNGQKIYLRGANRHQSFQNVGDAASNSMQYRDALQIKENGFNAVRATHYPNDPAFLDAADEIGLLVIECQPGWQNFTPSTKFYDLTLRDAREMIRRDRNRPSVILWETSLNETAYSSSWAQEVTQAAHAEYPGNQLYTAADYGLKGSYYDVNYKVVDTNWSTDPAGWTDFSPNKPFFTREWGDFEESSKALRKEGEAVMNTQVMTRQRYLNGDGYSDWGGLDANNRIGGYFLWSWNDYIRGSTTKTLGSGTVDIDRYEKYGYYWLQSMQSAKDPLYGPMVFIASEYSPTSSLSVNVFSNCDSVKLYQNNVLVKEITRAEASNSVPNIVRKGGSPIFTFNLDRFVAGELRAEALLNGAVVKTHTVRTPGQAHQLQIEVRDRGIKPIADGSDLIPVYFKVVDADGTIVPNYTGTIKISVAGEGQLVGKDIPRIGVEEQNVEGGIGFAFVRTSGTSGNIQITAESDGLVSATQKVSTLPYQGLFVQDGQHTPWVGGVEKLESKEDSYKNIAIGKPITSSSEQTGNYAVNAVDNDESTKWSANGSSLPQWLKVDLGQIYSIKGFKMLWEKQNDVYKYNIEVSKDGLLWKKVVDRSTNTAPNGAEETVLADCRGRYVRINIVGSITNNDWAALYEFKVFPADEQLPGVIITDEAIQKIEASSETEPGRGTDKLRDGDTTIGTGWLAKSTALPQSVTVKFNKPQTLTGSRIYWEKDSNWYNYDLEVSSDGQVWQKALDGRYVGGQQFTPETFAKAYENINYARVTINQIVAGGGYRVGMAELVLYGQDQNDTATVSSITAPAPITGLALKTAKTATALGLPGTVTLVTDAGSIDANVTWDLSSANYDQNANTAQSFTVPGTVTLPKGIDNPNNVPLTTSINVTVNKIPQSQMTATATSQETSGENNAASMAIDGNPQTIWHTKWDKSDILPQSITLKLGGTFNIDKISYLPRQSGGNGIITGYNLYVSMDGVTFTKVASGTWANNNSEKTATFDPTDASYVKLEATAAVNGWASAAEINVLVSDKQPPTTTDNAPSGWVKQDTTVTLSAIDGGSGVANTYYTVNDGAEQTGTSVVLSKEGVHELVYWSVDKAGNVEQAHTVTVSIDKTAPKIAVTVPGDKGIYEDSGDLTPQMKLTDNLSGVDNSKTTVKLDSHSYEIGTTIPLYTLPLGQHTLVVSSTDLAGNQVSKTVQFTTVASIDSLKAMVTHFADNKGIDNIGITNSLLVKLANNDLNSFMNEVKAQSGKHISSEAANYLLRDAQYVLTQK